MSSPEAHSGTPNQQNPYREHNLNPDAEAFVADGNNYAYGAEENDGDASPELAPLDAEAEAYYNDAREALHDAEGPIRHMYQDEIDRALGDLQVQAKAEEKAAPSLDKNKKQMESIDKRIEERQKIVDRLRKELDEKNKTGNKYKTSTNRLRWHEEKLRNLQAEKRSIGFRKEKIDGKLAQALPNDPEHRTESNRALRANLYNIDKEIERRREIQAKLEDPSASDETRRILQQEVDRWPRNDEGEIETEDQLRERLTREADEAYGQTRENEAAREKNLRFEEAYEKISEKYLEHLKIVDDDNADPIKRQQAILELDKADKFRDGLIGADETEEFKAWVQAKAETERADEIEEKMPKVDVADAFKKKKEAELRTAVEALEGLAATVTKLSGRADILANQFNKLTLQANEIQASMQGVTDPLMKNQLQEAFNKIDKEIVATVAEQQEIAEKQAQAAQHKPELEKALAQKEQEVENATRAATNLLNSLNRTADQNYIHKLRVAGL